MFVSETEVRHSVWFIISKMETAYTANNVVQYCSLIHIRTATAFVRQNALGSPRVPLVSLASGSV